MITTIKDHGRASEGKAVKKRTNSLKTSSVACIFRGSFKFLKITFTHLSCVEMQTCEDRRATVHMERAEDSLWEEVLSFHHKYQAWGQAHFHAESFCKP